MNKLVMDYLITEGYPSAAERFAMEANIELETDQSYIRERVQIRDFIHQGDLQQAIEHINDLDSEVCMHNFSTQSSFMIIFVFMHHS